MFSEINAVCLVQYTIPLPQNTTVLSSLILTCVMHNQMEAKAVMSWLLQHFSPLQYLALLCSYLLTNPVITSSAL